MKSHRLQLLRSSAPLLGYSDTPSHVADRLAYTIYCQSMHPRALRKPLCVRVALHLEGKSPVLDFDTQTTTVPERTREFELSFGSGAEDVVRLSFVVVTGFVVGAVLFRIVPALGSCLPADLIPIEGKGCLWLGPVQPLATKAHVTRVRCPCPLATTRYKIASTISRGRAADEVGHGRSNPRGDRSSYLR